jgi:16S rRNA (guanine527-N7)-methyltransferase
MEQRNRDMLAEGLASYGVAATEQALDALAKHLAMVVEWNERMNLTAITQERDMVVKHVIDSASALSVIPLGPGTRVLDVGTGAGFPGVVLKCLAPGVHMTLLESLNKRCSFLQAVGQEVVDPLGGPHEGYNVVWGRAEDFGRNASFREGFDLVVARAVAELRVLSEYCLPFCRVGGHFLAMKGPSVGEELSAAEKAISVLGGSISAVKEITLPEDAGTRTFVLVKKVKSTPAAYPRKAGTPSKTPL